MKGSHLFIKEYNYHNELGTKWIILKWNRLIDLK